MEERDTKLITLDDLIRRNLSIHLPLYFNWIRHVVTLALGTLTALVALQGHYVPRHPVVKPALAICWVALLLTILCGLIALLEEYQGPIRSARRIAQARVSRGDEFVVEQIKRGLGQPVPKTHKWAVRLMGIMFPVALIGLCIFSVANFLQA